MRAAKTPLAVLEDLRDPALRAALAEPVRAPLLPRQWLGLALLAVALLAAPWVLTRPFTHHVLILILLYALMAQAWNILAGYCGQISLGHAVFFGLGAYCAAFPFHAFRLNPWLGLLLGIGVSMAIALGIGYPTFRLRGHYFAIATLVIGEIVQTVFLRWEWVGAASGIHLPIVRESPLLNFQFHTSKLPYYYIALALLALACATVWWLERSKLGFYFRAIREDPDAARSLGINLTAYKLLAIMLSAAFMSAAGSFYAQYVLVVEPESVFPGAISIIVVLMAVLGGVGTLWGPLIGAAVLIPLSEGSRVYFGGTGRTVDLMIYGALIVLISLTSPSGVVGLLRKALGRRRPPQASGPSNPAGSHGPA